MKTDIKKKFIDILFESDEDEETVITEPVIEKKPLKKEDTPINAKDILYRKSDRSAFINLDENNTKKSKASEDKEEEEYELSSQISPIFGVIKESSSRKIKPKVADESLVNKPDSSHLEIITSPIYGYGKREDYINEQYYADNSPVSSSDEEELHRLIDNDENGYDGHTYDDLTSEEDEEELSLFSAFDEEE